MRIDESPSSKKKFDINGSTETEEQTHLNALAILNNVPTAVMKADKDLVIQYINPASEKTLKLLADHLPIAPEKIIGSSIDIFHKDPSYQRKLLSNPKNLPVTSIIEIGPEKAELNVNPTYSESGDYLGPTVTWSIVTEKLKLEREQSRMQSMLSNAPINIMMGDKDNKIVYLNPASEKTLKSIAHLLPISPEKVLGSSVDVFHKNPAYQRKILSDHRNLPTEAEINIGNEIANLLVSPIYDSSGEYIGPMVTWSLITESKELERKAKEQQERERQTQEELIAVVDKILEVVSSAEQGDLTRVVDINSDDAIGQLSRGLNRFLNTMKLNIERIGGDSETLTAAASELASVSKNLLQNVDTTSGEARSVSAASEEMAVSIETVSSGSEEMMASIKEISNTSQQAAAVARSAVEIISKASSTMTSLGESSNEIGNVVRIITSIAEQTNLLALNATIESARAGEAGKGFSVVANEVKELARQTAAATEDIAQKIKSIQQESKDAITSIEDIRKVIQKIDENSSVVAAAIEEQTATTNEISRSVTESSKGAIEISASIVRVAEATRVTKDMADSTQESADDLLKLAQGLSDIVASFKVK